MPTYRFQTVATAARPIFPTTLCSLIACVFLFRYTA